MVNLVTMKRNKVFTDSLIIAEGTGAKHKNVRELIEKYKTELETFGKVPFKTEALKSGQQQKVYFLNEQQATFLITLSRNTSKVVRFKLELVRQFYEMGEFLKEKGSRHYKEVQGAEKIRRRQETDVIKEFVEYAKSCSVPLGVIFNHNNIV